MHYLYVNIELGGHQVRWWLYAMMFLHKCKLQWFKILSWYLKWGILTNNAYNFNKQLQFKANKKSWTKFQNDNIIPPPFVNIELGGRQVRWWLYAMMFLHKCKLQWFKILSWYLKCGILTNNAYNFYKQLQFKANKKTWTKFQNDNIIPPPFIKYIQHELRNYLLQTFMHAQCTIEIKLFFLKLLQYHLVYIQTKWYTKQKLLHEKIMGVILIHHGTKICKSKKKLTKMMNVCLQALSFNRALLVFNKRNTRNKSKKHKKVEKNIIFLTNTGGKKNQKRKQALKN